MKKVCQIFIACLCLGSFAAGQSMSTDMQRPTLGLGYDLQREQFLINFGLLRYFRGELGAAVDWDNREDADDEFDIDATVAILIGLHAYQNLNGFLYVGGLFDDIGREDIDDAFSSDNTGDVRTRILLAYEPELMLWNHLALSTNFGFMFNILPDARINNVGPSELFSDVKIKFLF
jgi:hypothetical protein